VTGERKVEQRVADLRDQAFSVVQALGEYAATAGPREREAATKMQTVAYRLGEVERCLHVGS
jgi:hypothetical protein